MTMDSIPFTAGGNPTDDPELRFTAPESRARPCGWR
jgi:hypothetical protein